MKIFKFLLVLVFFGLVRYNVVEIPGASAVTVKEWETVRAKVRRILRN